LQLIHAPKCKMAKEKSKDCRAVHRSRTGLDRRPIKVQYEDRESDWSKVGLDRTGPTWTESQLN